MEKSLIGTDNEPVVIPQPKPDTKPNIDLPISPVKPNPFVVPKPIIRPQTKPTPKA